MSLAKNLPVRGADWRRTVSIWAKRADSSPRAASGCLAMLLSGRRQSAPTAGQVHDFILHRLAHGRPIPDQQSQFAGVRCAWNRRWNRQNASL